MVLKPKTTEQIAKMVRTAICSINFPNCQVKNDPIRASYVFCDYAATRRKDAAKAIEDAEFWERIVHILNPEDK